MGSFHTNAPVHQDGVMAPSQQIRKGQGRIFLASIQQQVSPGLHLQRPDSQTTAPKRFWSAKPKQFHGSRNRRPVPHGCLPSKQHSSLENNSFLGLTSPFPNHRPHHLISHAQNPKTAPRGWAADRGSRLALEDDALRLGLPFGLPWRLGEVDATCERASMGSPTGPGRLWKIGFNYV